MTGFRLDGRSALVTGAARGIGLETSRLLGARGASVMLTDIDGDEVTAAAESIGGSAVALTVDVTDRAALEAAVVEAGARFGGLDVVVANAGIAPVPRTVGSIDSEQFERVIEVDLLGVYRTVHAALPSVAARRGQVVLVASVYAFAAGVMASPYAASKAAVEQLGRALRIELAAHGAGATVVYWGFADTRLVREAFEDPIAAGMESTLPQFATGSRPSWSPSACGRDRTPRAARSSRAGTDLVRAARNLGPLLDAGRTRDPRIAEPIERAEAQAAESRSRTTKV